MYCIIIMSLPETDYKIRNPDLLGVATLGGSSFEALRNPVVVDVEVTRGSLYADRWCSSSKMWQIPKSLAQLRQSRQRESRRRSSGNLAF